MSGTTDSVHGKENLLAAQKAAGKQTGKPDITFTAHGDVARDVLERLQARRQLRRGENKGAIGWRKNRPVRRTTFACGRSG